MGLFYNGNNATDLRSGYGLSDFDRTHVINFTYLYELPKFFELTSWRGRIADGWAVAGLAIIQSGQPYSVIDYSGAVGSIYYGTSDGITNPIVPLAPGCTPSSAYTGDSGTNPGQPALNPNCFSVPLLNPGDLGGAIPAGDTFETNFTTGQRNIFRQPWQRRTDLSIIKMTQLTERVAARFTFEIFNLTNTPSFDIPINNVHAEPRLQRFPRLRRAALFLPHPKRHRHSQQNHRQPPPNPNVPKTHLLTVNHNAVRRGTARFPARPRRAVSICPIYPRFMSFQSKFLLDGIVLCIEPL